MVAYSFCFLIAAGLEAKKAATTARRGRLTGAYSHSRKSPPPEKKSSAVGNAIPFINNLANTYQYATDADEFIHDHVTSLGPIFKSYCGFRPAVFIGGEEATREFIKLDREIFSDVVPRDMLSQPLLSLLASEAPFLGQQVGSVHKWERKVTTVALQGKVLQRTLPKIIDESLKRFVLGVHNKAKEFPSTTTSQFDLNCLSSTTQKKRDTVCIDLTREVTECCIDMISAYLTGNHEPLSEQEHVYLKQITEGILALNKFDPRFARAQRAKRSMQKSILKRIKVARGGNEEHGSGSEARNKVSNKKSHFAALPQFQRLASNNDKVFGGMLTDTALVETYLQSYLAGDLVGALVANAVCFLGSKPEIALQLMEKSAEKNNISEQRDEAQSTKSSAGYLYARGIVRETLRLMTITQLPTRLVTPKDVSICGYHIHKGTLLIVEPRIGNKSPLQFPEPESFQPLRWVHSNGNVCGGVGYDAPSTASEVPEMNSKSSSCPFLGHAAKYQTSSPSWIPGGAGNHACPGMDLAEEISIAFLQTWVTHFDCWEPANAKHDMAKPPLRKMTSIAPGPEFALRVSYEAS